MAIEETLKVLKKISEMQADAEADRGDLENTKKSLYFTNIALELDEAISEGWDIITAKEHLEVNRKAFEIISKAREEAENTIPHTHIIHTFRNQELSYGALVTADCLVVNLLEEEAKDDLQTD